MTNKTISIGIIGTGFGKEIAKNFKAVDPTCKIYFASRDTVKTKTIAAELSADGTFDTWQELVSSPQIDLVVIASPSSLHKEMFNLAVKNNKHILVEKPAALTSAEICEMSQVPTNKIIAVNHEGRFNPIILYIRDLINSEKIGQILTVRCAAYLNWFSNSEYKEGWGNYKELGGGHLNSVGTHQIDLVRYILNMPQIISGSVNTIAIKDPKFSDKVTADTQLSAHFLTDKNTSLQLTIDDYCFGYKNFTLEVIGSQGIVMYSDLQGLRVSFSNTQPLEEVKVNDPLPDINLGRSILSKSMKYMAKAMIESIKTGTPNPNFCSLKQAKDNLEVFETYLL